MTDDLTPADPPAIDVRLAQLRALHDRARQIIQASVLSARADAVRIIMTPEAARELFAILDVKPDEELC